MGAFLCALSFWATCLLNVSTSNVNLSRKWTGNLPNKFDKIEQINMVDYFPKNEVIYLDN